MIRRDMQGDFLTEVANHIDVRPHMGGKEGEALDIRPAARNPANIVLTAERPDGVKLGGWVLHPILPGVYEIHTMFTPRGRGRFFYDASREMFRYVFTRTDALEIVTKCPDDNPGARMASSQLGFRERFRREDAWGPGVGISYRVFSVDEWFVRDQACFDEGLVFHLALEKAKDEAESTLPVHGDDEAHDRAAGAALLMVRGGNTAKGVAFYNRWAAFAGYAQVAALGPTLLDIGDAIIDVRPERLDVITVRGVP